MNSGPSMEQQFVKKLSEVVKDNFSNEQFQVTDLASEMGMSRATLHRKTKAATGKTISQFINEVRLNAAKQHLANRSGTVSEVAFMVGFNSSTYFIKCFHDYYGYSPGDVLKDNFQNLEEKENKPEKSQKSLSLPLKIGLATVVVILVVVVFKWFDGRKVDTALPRPATNNPAALNLYLQGLKLMDVYAGSQDAQHFNEAEQKYKEAIALDSTFGDAYSRLAEIYLIHKAFTSSAAADNYVKTGLTLINRAEHFGVGDTDFLLKMKSIYYQRILDYEEALRIFEMRWENREKDYHYYSERGNHAYLMRDYGATIENLLAYLHLKPEHEIAQYDRLMKLTLTFSKAGFKEEAQEFAYRQFTLIRDSIKYWSWYPRIIYECGSLQKTINYYEDAYQKYELGTTVFNKLLEMYMLTGLTEAGLELLPNYVEYNEKISGSLVPNYLIGYFHYLNGNENLSTFHFRSEIRRWEYFYELSETQESLTNYLTIAACYAMLKDKEASIKSLQKLTAKTSIPYLWVLKLQKSPMFDKLILDEDFVHIRNEIQERFSSEQETIRDALNKYPIEYTHHQNGEISVLQH